MGSIMHSVEYSEWPSAKEVQKRR